MASDSILNSEIARLGQSQDERSPPELDPAFAPLDGRTPADRLAEARRLAEHLRYYGFDPKREDGNWQGYFPENGGELLARDDGSVAPHLGLFGAFLEQLKPAGEALNALTGSHLDFQYRRVLGFESRPAQPEHAHLSLALKKAAAPFAITPAHRFMGGKDATGVERLYQPLRETVIGQGKVSALHSIYRRNGLYFAPVANSADGLGTPLDPARPHWSAFGHAGLSPAPVGFALTSPVLRLREGARTVVVDLTLGFLPAGQDAQDLADGLQAFISGEQGWLGPYDLSGELAGNTLSLGFAVAGHEAAVIDYDPVLHGGAFAADAPVVQVLVRPEKIGRYADLARLRVDKIALRVTAKGVRGLSLENDHGALNPKKAFLPFGPQPVKGARFMIGCGEALSKQLSDLSVSLRWQGAPGNLPGWYAHYPSVSAMNNGVSARLVYADRSGKETSRELDLMDRADGVTTLSPSSPPVSAYSPATQNTLLYSLIATGTTFGKLFADRYLRAQPVVSRENVPPPPVRSGFVTVALIDDFLHAEYRKETMRLAKIPANTTVLNEPWAPLVQEITLSYAASSPAIDLSSRDEAAFAAGLEVQLFHVGPFGQRREHPFLRSQYDWVADKAVGLLPAFPDEGEFIVGVSGVAAGDSIHLLLQVAEGSADPELPAQTVRWSVLCDNYWRPVAPEEMALDTTRSLRASGIVGIVLGRHVTTGNTWLPPGQVWLKAAVPEHSAAACRLLDVLPNAVEVVRVWPAEALAPQAETLPAGSIAKLQSPPPALKQLTQPYTTFGGRAAESAAMRNRRAAERLRHRQRCVTPWDYERLLLEAFPAVHRIKCIPHASDKSWMAPGNVLIVAIPDLRNQNAPDPLQPRVDLDTLTQMSELAKAHAGPQLTVRVRNAEFIEIRLDFKVRFRPGYPFDYTRQQLHEALVRALSPWAFASDAPLQFGGRLYRSVLLDFVEELPYVDFVTDFRCGLAGPGDLLLNDAAEITVDRPDAILVSAARHLIAEAP
ncbi:MAG TPA: hypothetical protein PK225_03305 [Azonexus sp.]|jgi:hypothetical protein|nr:hypothetical protein [Azonexus sp.]